MISITANTTEHNSKIYTLSVTEDNTVLYTTHFEVGATPQEGLQDKLAKVALLIQMLKDKDIYDVVRELADLIPVYN